MSFQEARSAISICNLALSKISQAPLQGAISDPHNQAKLAGRECALWYPKVVRTLLGKHHWGHATRRAALVTNVTNDRASEWFYSYVAPADMAFPVSTGPYAGNTSAIGYYWGIGYLIARLYGQPMFRYQGGTIYSSTPGAELEYVSYDITEADFSEEFENMVITYLAAQLARSVAKDEELARGFEEQGMQQLNQGIAHELNMGGARYDDKLSEGEMIRNGGFVSPWSSLGFYR